jgi:hypothetical protein
MRLAMRTVGLPETGWDDDNLCFGPETTSSGAIEELSSTSMASCEVRLLLATAAEMRETLHDGRSSSSSSALSTVSSFSASRSRSASPCWSNDSPNSFPSKLILVRARTQRLRENSVKVLEASKRSLQERLDEHSSSSSLLNYVQRSFDADTVGTLSSRSANEASSIEEEIMAPSHEQNEADIAQHLWLRHSRPLLSLVNVEPVGHDETFETINPIVKESSLKTISMQLEADCRCRRHQWILLSALLGFILVGRVGAVTTCICMTVKDLVLSVGELSPPLPANPAVTSNPTSVAMPHKSPVVGMPSSRLDDPDDDDDTTIMLPQHSSNPLHSPHKIVFNTKHDSLGVWLPIDSKIHERFDFPNGSESKIHLGG